MNNKFQCPACGTKNGLPCRCWDFKTSLHYMQLSPNGLEKSLEYFGLQKINRDIEKEIRLLKLKIKVQERFKKIKEQKRKKFIKIKPKYDAIFYGGVNWLDSL
jgi:hypothetical protein